MFNLWEKNSLKDKDKNFFWYKNKDIAVYLFIFSLGKFYTLFNDKKEEVEKLKNFIIYLQRYYFDFYKKEIIEEPLLNGKEIIEILNLTAGKKVGEIKNKLLEKQIFGLIKTKEEAISFIKSLKK